MKVYCQKKRKEKIDKCLILIRLILAKFRFIWKNGFSGELYYKILTTTNERQMLHGAKISQSLLMSCELTTPHEAYRFAFQLIPV